MNSLFMAAFLVMFSFGVLASPVGPQKNGLLEKLDYMAFVKQYLGYYDVSGEDLTQINVLSVREFKLFGKKGLLVCFVGGDNKKFLPEPQPYGLFVSKKIKYDTGGGQYLCDQNKYIKKDNSDYKVIKKVKPIYPVEDLENTIVGNVILEYAIDEKGKAKEIWVVKEGPNPRFTKSAIMALSKFEYQPRIIDGVPRSVYGVRQNIIFEAP
ncbi:TonB family protein [Alteromonadaceae bacterium 2753L.S.0a.02]|nr:TonB family protein [Alteromonadaceae bacterium 2753L.S.0a.02]